jgi:hypothetical protein
MDATHEHMSVALSPIDPATAASYAERRGLEPHPGCDPEQKRLTSRLRHLTALRSAGDVIASAAT